MKQKIEAIRKQLDLSQEDFAFMLGITVPTYINKVKKRVEWKGSELMKIKKLSGINLDDIDFC